MRGTGPSFGIVIEYVLNTLPAPGADGEFYVSLECDRHPIKASRLQIPASFGQPLQYSVGSQLNTRGHEQPYFHAGGIFWDIG